MTKKLIRETLTKSDVKGEIKNYIDSKTFKDVIAKIVKDRIKNEKEIEDMVVDITRNVLTQLYKTLWVRRGIWQNTLSNKKN